MTPQEEHELLVYSVARRRLVRHVLVLDCVRCHARLQTEVTKREHFMHDMGAEDRLATMAVAAGWETDRMGELACATCYADIQQRAGQVQA